MHDRPAVTEGVLALRRRIAERLRSLREARGWSQLEASEAIGIHPVHLSRLESGSVNLTVTTLVALALTYETSVASLVADAPADVPLPSATE